MKFLALTRKLILWFTSFLILTPAVFAQQAETVFKKEELQQLVAPVALYPDALLAQVLMAATYPLQVAQAAQWQVNNSKLSEAERDKALSTKDWDPSVKSLVAVPSVLKMMNDDLEWTQKLGDAFLAQQADVMNEVQFLRSKAQEAGNLKTNKQQKVTKQDSVIIIEPAAPQVVYVPVYNPSVVYGTWWYPSYPPYYFRPPAGAAFVAGFYWGAAIAISSNYWGWGHCDWHRTNINIDVDRYNRINVNKNHITSNTWHHNPSNRGPVPYRDARSREQFGSKSRVRSPSREAKGFSGQGDHAPAHNLKAADKKPKPKQGLDRPHNVKQPRKSVQPKPSRPSKNKSARVSRPTAFDGGNARAVRAGSERGHKSRAVARGGGHHGHGGGRSFGGRRR